MDTTPIAARLSVIARSVNALKEIQKLAYEDFAREHILKDSAERNFQVAIQAALDIASLILADQSVELQPGVCDGLASAGGLDSGHQPAAQH